MCPDNFVSCAGFVRQQNVDEGAILNKSGILFRLFSFSSCNFGPSACSVLKNSQKSEKFLVVTISII
jgi:hypothetical protein